MQWSIRRLNGHLVGGLIGAAVGIAATRAASREADTDGRIYKAQLGVLVLTEKSVVVVDCGYTVRISENGVRHGKSTSF
jgi:hypothetical protein